MANLEHLAKLREALFEDDVDMWDEWRQENPDIRPDLSGIDLSKMDFTGMTQGLEIDVEEVDYQIVTNTRIVRVEVGVDLSNTNLNGTNLADTNMKEVNLTGASLKGAKLTGANLELAVLESANLSQADLGGVYLDNTNLDDATLQGARLIGTRITSDTSLKGTDFADAIMGNAIVADVSLANARGLESVNHRGQSIISTSTLERSHGQIPELFLRGCGLSDAVLAFAKTLTNIDYYSCFISHSSDDKAFARRVYHRLQSEGIRCWMDEHDINVGDDFYEEIDKGISLWDKVLLCCSEASLSSSWWVDLEIDKTFAKERELMKKRKKKVLALIPLDLDGYLFNDEYEGGKKVQIQARLAANFKGWEDDDEIFEREIKRVIKALRTDGGKEAPPISKL